MSEHNYTNFWELIAGHLFGENSDKEERELQEFLKSDNHQKTFKQAQEVHAKLPHTKPLQQASVHRSWNQIHQYLHRKKVRKLFTLTKYAAIIIVAFIVGSIVNRDLPPKSTPERYTEISVPPGQMSNLTLFDGTRVWLNSGTTLKYAHNFGTDSREVALDGEAFFDVQKSEMPFIVRLKTSEIEVLGTSFNAVSFATENFSEVTLVEGTVQVNTLSGKAIRQMKPTEQLLVSDNLQDIRLKNVDTDFYQSWTKGKIVFREERLKDIVPRLERWYNVEIQLKTPDIGELRFSGTILKSKPFDQIARAFELLLPLKISYKNNMSEKDLIIISKN